MMYREVAFLFVVSQATAQFGGMDMMSGGMGMMGSGMDMMGGGMPGVGMGGGMGMQMDTCPMNPSQICCAGAVPVLRIHGMMSRCCGRVQYSSATQQCCSGAVVARPRGGMMGNPMMGGNMMGNPMMGGGMMMGEMGGACCGRAMWNFATQLCCNGRLFARGIMNRCCGMSIYNPATQVCCMGLPKPKTLGCFGIGGTQSAMMSGMGGGLMG